MKDWKAIAVSAYFYIDEFTRTPQEKHALRDKDGFTVDLYECQVCGALVSDIYTHAGYHEDKGE